jgi:Iap family predicted aminopeptidase
MSRRWLWCWLFLSAPLGAFQEYLTPETIQQRLETVTGKAADRRARLEDLFREAGCTGDAMTSQIVPRSKQPNVICTLAGSGPGTIVVGGHHDFIDRGTGAVDDWSGTALLPSLYQTMAGKPRKHTFIFIGFAAEEIGLHGSAEYVKKLTPEQRTRIRAMINLECLGLTPPKAAKSPATQLLDIYVRVSQALRIPPGVVDLDERYFSDDSRSFRNAKIPAVVIHSITQETLRILHSTNDNLKAIDPKHYYDAYRLSAVYLASLDSLLE